jgi:kelch-like protein 2/3
MENVRLPLLSREYLFQKVDGESLFETQPRCKDFIIEALKFHLASGDPTKLASFGNSARTKPRQPIGLPKVMLAIGGQAPKAIRNVECYDFKEERWFQVTKKNSKVRRDHWGRK